MLRLATVPRHRYEAVVVILLSVLAGTLLVAALLPPTGTVHAPLILRKIDVSAAALLAYGLAAATFAQIASRGVDGCAGGRSRVSQLESGAARVVQLHVSAPASKRLIFQAPPLRAAELGRRDGGGFSESRRH